MPSTRRLVPVAAALVAFAAVLPAPAEAAPARPGQPQSASAASPAGQAQLSRDWKRLQTPNFTIAGTVSPKDLARLATELENFCDVLAQTQPALTLTSPVPTYVVALKNLDEGGGFRPRDAGPPRERVRILSERRLMPLERLLTLDTLPDAPEERWLFYAQSWAIVHFLLLGQENAPPNQIVTYLEAIRSGQSRDSAFQQAFGSTYEAFGWKVSKYANGQS